jgi:hypothetical protein
MVKKNRCLLERHMWKEISAALMVALPDWSPGRLKKLYISLDGLRVGLLITFHYRSPPRIVLQLCFALSLLRFLFPTLYIFGVIFPFSSYCCLQPRQGLETLSAAYAKDGRWWCARVLRRSSWCQRNQSFAWALQRSYCYKRARWC